MPGIQGRDRLAKERKQIIWHHIIEQWKCRSDKDGIPCAEISRSSTPAYDSNIFRKDFI